jgi:hypothetical protein
LIVSRILLKARQGNGNGKATAHGTARQNEKVNIF